ncbi:MAG: hypothetical protein GY719_23635 [bacterium]|nr:hypothetical protein [bacterium]
MTEPNDSSSTPRSKIVKKPATPKAAEPEPQVVTTRAADLLQEFQKEQSTRVERKVAKDLKQYQYYHRCHVCQGPGIFYSVNPYGRVITDEDWHSTYKAVDDRFADHPFCQICEKTRGVEEHLLMDRVPRNQMPAGKERLAGWRTVGRWSGYLMKMPKDPEAREKRPVERAAPRSAREPHQRPIQYDGGETE